jgi:hypothetical protein
MQGYTVSGIMPGFKGKSAASDGFSQKRESADAEADKQVDCNELLHIERIPTAEEIDAQQDTATKAMEKVMADPTDIERIAAAKEEYLRLAEMLKGDEEGQKPINVIKSLEALGQAAIRFAPYMQQDDDHATLIVRQYKALLKARARQSGEESLQASDTFESTGESPKESFEDMHLAFVRRAEPVVRSIMDWKIPREDYEACEELLKKLKEDAALEDVIQTWADIFTMFQKTWGYSLFE